MFSQPSVNSACLSTAKLTALSLRADWGATFHRWRFKIGNVKRIEANLRNLTQDELLARLNYHMEKVQHLSESEEVTKLNKQTHVLLFAENGIDVLVCFEVLTESPCSVCLTDYDLFSHFYEPRLWNYPHFKIQSLMITEA